MDTLQIGCGYSETNRLKSKNRMEKKKKWSEMTAREAAQALADRRSRPLPSCRETEVSQSCKQARAAYWEKVNELDRHSTRKWTAEELRARALTRLQSRVPGEISERYRELVDAFSAYFAGQPGRLPLNKGIYLHGTVGCGKTTLFRIFNFGSIWQCDKPCIPLTGENTLLFRSVSCNSIARDYADKDNGGVQVLKRYFAGNYLFDDLGTENVAKYYGTPMDVMGEIIQERYDRNGITFITSNYDLDGIRKAYGERISSRLAEMCSFIDMKINEDYRR